MAGTPWGVYVMYDPPHTDVALSSFGHSLTMQFDALLAGVRVTALLDSGAEANFVSRCTAESHKLGIGPVTAEQQIVLLDGRLVPILGTVDACLRFNDKSAPSVTCFVMEGQLPCDFVLGSPWLHENGCTVNFVNRTCVVATKPCNTILTAANANHEADAEGSGVTRRCPDLGPEPVALTATQFLATARRSDRVFLALVSLCDEETPAVSVGDLDPDVCAILERFPQVFPPDLPSGLPRDVRQVRQFLGPANYFRRFINGYAELTRPLTSLLKKDISFRWDADEKSAFQGVKQALSEAPCLALPDPTKPFVVVSDASGFALGGVLLQDGRPIAYESRQLAPAERNYDAGERELLAV